MEIYLNLNIIKSNKYQPRWREVIQLLKKKLNLNTLLYYLFHLSHTILYYVEFSKIYE